MGKYSVNVGDEVRVIRSWFYLVNVGAVGTVISCHDGNFTVRFTWGNNTFGHDHVGDYIELVGSTPFMKSLYKYIADNRHA